MSWDPIWPNPLDIPEGSGDLGDSWHHSPQGCLSLISDEGDRMTRAQRRVQAQSAVISSEATKAAQETAKAKDRENWRHVDQGEDIGRWEWEGGRPYYPFAGGA
jgi:hypothetical protein